MSNVKHHTVHASAAETTTGNSGAFSAEGQVLALGVSVSAVSGTNPTLDLEIEWSADGTNWGSADGAADSFAQITATGGTGKQVTVKGPYFRVVWTIGGTTPSFTFVAEAVVG